jgi:hypothetical protein
MGNTLAENQNIEPLKTKCRLDRIDFVFNALGICLGLSIFAVLLHGVSTQPIEYDAAGYWWLAQIASGTDISNFDSQHLTILFNFRLLGYPILIAPFVFLFESEHQLRVSVAVFQVVLHLTSVVLFSLVAGKMLSKLRYRIFVVTLCTVPFPYFLAVEMLADSISLSFAILCVAFSINSFTKSRFLTPISSIVIAHLFAGLAMAIRPDNYGLMIFVTVNGFFVTRKILMSTRWRRQSVNFASLAINTALSIGGYFICRIPHFIMLYKVSGVRSFSPLSFPPILPEFEFATGLIKRFTLLPPNGGQFALRNPFLDESIPPSNIVDWHWYLEEPLKGIGYLLLKTFSLVDWDWPATYFYEVPTGPNYLTSILGYFIVLSGALGMWSFFKLALTSRNETAMGISIAMLLGSIPYMAIKTLTHVELRYGLGLMMTLSVFAIWWHTQPNRSQIQRINTTILILVWMFPFVMLSAWIRQGLLIG